MQVADPGDFLKALLKAPRPGSDRILAFYDSRADLICKDGRLLLIPLDDHICHRGDGLFESICFRENKIFALDAHISRMEQSAALLALNPPCDFGRIRDLVLAVARAGGESHGDIRIFLTRGCGGFGISPAECPQTALYIIALSAPLPPQSLYDHGVTAFASAYPAKQPWLARIKNTGYLPNVFMSREAGEKNMDVAVAFDEYGHMGEAAIANVALVDKDGYLRHPPMENVLPGTTLLAALKIAAAKMPVKEGPVHQKEILEAREMMMFTSASLCVAITHFDGLPVGEGEAAGKPGPVALWLKDELLKWFLANGVPF